MTVAEIHGKISESGTNLSERMEDLLTSDVFGCLRYLPPELALLPFLRTARSFRGKVLQIAGEVVRVHSSFWPWLNVRGHSSCEPDVVLGLETEAGDLHLVMIEAKYFSGVSDEEDEDVHPGNQLARELDALSAVGPATLKWDPGMRVASRTLLLVTPDMAMPRSDLEAALDEWTRKRGQEGDIFWTSWRRVQSILEGALASETDPGRRAVAEDMRALLVRKALTMFQGVDRVTQRLSPSYFEFYRSTSLTYDWPDIPEPAGTLNEYMYEVASNG